jgi:pSer/pThr/pTyr-binding forkhead associated (FHA) protein
MIVKLLVVQGRPKGKAIQFGHGEYVFGRGAECHVRPNSEWVSRQHCLLRVTPEAAILRDLASRNGTLVNGTLLVDDRRLNDGDLVQVGPLVFEVKLEPGAMMGRPSKANSAFVPGEGLVPKALALHGEDEPAPTEPTSSDPLRPTVPMPKSPPTKGT